MIGFYFDDSKVAIQSWFTLHGTHRKNLSSQRRFTSTKDCKLTLGSLELEVHLHDNFITVYNLVLLSF